MYATSINLSLRTRNKVARILNARLADGLDLAAQLKHAHWNVRGTDFIALHELFDRLEDEFRDHADTLAERTTALGGLADGRLPQSAKRTTLPAYPDDADDAPAHLTAIAAALAQFGGLVRQAIKETADLDDLATSDVFTEISRAADKALWLIEAHLCPSMSRAGSHLPGVKS